MHILVSPNQSAFVVGRSITDIVLLGQKLVKDIAGALYHLDVVSKLTYKKAFDTLDWEFLLEVLSVMNFPLEFTSWIK